VHIRSQLRIVSTLVSDLKQLLSRDRGRPSHVLLTAEEYQKITGRQKNIADLLAMPEAAEIEFEPPRLTGNLHKLTDFS